MSNKLLSFIIGLFSMAVVVAIMFCLAESNTSTFWIALSFSMFSIIASIIFQQVLLTRNAEKEMKILAIPGITISAIYIIAQIPMGIVFALGANSISYKITVLVNVIVLAAFWIIILSSVAGNNHIKSVDDRQKNHHIQL